MRISAHSLISSIIDKGIYWIADPEIAGGIPHPHICISKRDGTVISLVCGTSQRDKKIEFIRKIGAPMETLVMIDHKVSSNKLTKETYVNCNGVYHYEAYELKALHNVHPIEDKGIIQDFEYKLILEGFMLSKRIDQEFKDEIQEILDNL